MPGLECFARAESNVTVRFEEAGQRDNGAAARRAEARLPVPEQRQAGPPAREERIAARCAHADLTVRVRERDAAIARETLEVGHRWDTRRPSRCRPAAVPTRADHRRAARGCWVGSARSSGRSARSAEPHSATNKSPRGGSKPIVLYPPHWQFPHWRRWLSPYDFQHGPAPSLLRTPSCSHRGRVHSRQSIACRALCEATRGPIRLSRLWRGCCVLADIAQVDEVSYSARVQRARGRMRPRAATRAALCRRFTASA